MGRRPQFVPYHTESPRTTLAHSNQDFEDRTTTTKQAMNRTTQPTRMRLSPRTKRSPNRSSRREESLAVRLLVHDELLELPPLEAFLRRMRPLLNVGLAREGARENVRVPKKPYQCWDATTKFVPDSDQIWNL
jgi:hypothetical protein